jgi:predicted amino acid racemase
VLEQETREQQHDATGINDGTLLKRVVERNPALIEAAFRLHRDGRVPPNSWLIDLDGIAANATALATEAEVRGLRTYVMTKQYSRNPFVTHVAIKRGLPKAVAVDIHGARTMHRFGIPVGHIGHLNQVPTREMAAALRMRPDVITVYSVEAARRISTVASQLGVEQDLLVRPIGDGDVFFEGQEGGFPEAEVEDAVRRIMALPNVRVVGVTSFPCVRYNFGEGGRSDPEANPNLETITRVADRLRLQLGVEISQVNAPGNTAVETMKLLADAGATHVEPGHGLLGTTPNHIFDGSQPEVPTYVYVSEVSHHYNGRAYAYGGGLWTLLAGFLAVPGAPATPEQALVGSDLDRLWTTALTYEPQEQIIDYHASLLDGSRCDVGDTVVMAFYTQMQMNRSYTVPVSGVASGDLEVHGIFDMATQMLDEDYNPIPSDQVVSAIRSALERY